MTKQLTHLIAHERVADLQRAADHQRLVRAAKSQRPRRRGWPVARLRETLTAAPASVGDGIMRSPANPRVGSVKDLNVALVDIIAEDACQESVRATAGVR
jgi:hypothetical protein